MFPLQFAKMQWLPLWILLRITTFVISIFGENSRCNEFKSSCAQSHARSLAHLHMICHPKSKTHHLKFKFYLCMECSLVVHSHMQLVWPICTWSVICASTTLRKNCEKDRSSFNTLNSFVIRFKRGRKMLRNALWGVTSLIDTNLSQQPFFFWQIKCVLLSAVLRNFQWLPAVLINTKVAAFSRCAIRTSLTLYFSLKQGKLIPFSQIGPDSKILCNSKVLILGQRI